MITARADVVGSLLRPPELLRARADRAAGRITEVELRAVEDAAAEAAIRLQEEAGLEVVTDVEILRAEVAELVRRGALYIQLNAPHYALLLDDGTRAFYEARGWSLARWLAEGIAMDNAVIGNHPGVTFGFHLCRGNQGSRWLTAGAYDPIARAIFRGIRAERLLLEYDDERSGSFDALSGVPEDKA